MTMDFWEPLHVRVSEVTCGIQNDYKDPMHQEQGFWRIVAINKGPWTSERPLQFPANLSVAAGIPQTDLCLC